MSAKSQEDAAMAAIPVRKSPRLRTRSTKSIEALASRELSFKSSLHCSHSKQSAKRQKGSKDAKSDTNVLSSKSRKRKANDRSLSSSPDDSTVSSKQSDDSDPEMMDDDDDECFHGKDSKRPRSRHTMLDKLQPSKGFVSKTDVSVAPEDTIPMKRRPRMASLNAMAKVNAVLDCYTTGHRHHGEAKKSDGDGRNVMTLKSNQKRSTVSMPQASDADSSKSDRKSDSLCYLAVMVTKPNDQPISDSYVSSSNLTVPDVLVTEPFSGKEDKSIQTESNHKSVQTENVAHASHCACGNRLSKNALATNKAIIAIPVSSLIQANAGTHKLLIPFTKTHLMTHDTLKDAKDLTDEVFPMQSPQVMKCLQDIAINNALVFVNKPLTYLKSGTLKSSLHHNNDGRAQTVNLKIPKINFAATSTSTFSAFPKAKVFHPVKAVNLKRSNTSKDFGRKDSKGWTQKMVNGWVFGGDPVEKGYEYDDYIVTRRYYTCMKRSNEIINIRDSVLLKSGTKKKDLPYVARVAAIWEEDKGPNAGDMMVSVFWYYRPEQTEIDRILGFHGQMEVLASKHRDDNSVACIVDKCYVLSYPQYCRFRAKSCLYRESRRKPLSLVPPGESTRPGSMPPPNIEPSLVFFGRQVYDYRTGRILKSIT